MVIRESNDIMSDSIDQIVYDIGDKRYINIGKHCTLKCTFCPKTKGSWDVHQYNLSLSHQPSAEEIIDLIGDPTDYQEVVFCGYSEPTLRLKPLLAVAHYIKSQGGRVRVNTDGLANLVHKRNVLPDLGQCVDAISISMNANTEALYNKYCQPGLPGAFNAMLDFIEQAPTYIDEVTATAINGLGGVDIDRCEAMAVERGASFRRRELDIVG